MSYASDLGYKRTVKPKNYWKNTSGNGLIRTFMENKEFDVKSDFETLLNSGVITQTITDQLTYDLLDQKAENLWSVLLMTGYVTKADPEEDGNTVRLRIPNIEIASIFQDTVKAYFAGTADTGKISPLLD